MIHNFSFYFGWAGTIISFVLSWTPIVPFVKVFKKEDKIEIIPEAMLIFNILTRLTFCSYNYRTHIYVPLINSTVGVTISTGFAFAYLYLYNGRNLVKGLLASLLLLDLEIQYFYTGAFLIPWPQLVGNIAMVFNVGMFVAPGQNILRVIREKNYKLIPITTTIVSTICTLMWFLYGVFTRDLPYIVPNALGLIFSVINTYTWAYYYINRKKFAKEKEDKEDTTEQLKDIEEEKDTP